MKRLAAFVLLVGCEGDPVVAAPADAATDSAAAVDTTAPTDATDAAAVTDASPDAGCEVVAKNLLANPSFEEGSGANVDHWPADVVGTSGGADDCARWAQKTTTGSYEDVSIAIPIDADAGAEFEFGASVQRLDGNIDTIDVFLLTPSAEPASHRFVPVPESKKWYRTVGKLVLTAKVSSLTFGVASNSKAVRAYGIDRAYVIRTK